MIKLVKLSPECKREFLSGGKTSFPMPSRCPFCGGLATRCLIRWGYYRLKGKRCLEGLSPGLILYVQRFCCKHAGQTFSRLPDFLHPRKGHMQKLVGAVLNSLLVVGNSLCAVADEFGLYYQTIQWWLKNLAGNRQAKAACFAGSGALDAAFQLPRFDWCVSLWATLRNIHGTATEPLLVEATQAILAVTTAGLY